LNEICVEVNNVNSANEGNMPRHDILEVNNYLIDGLGTSSVDKWFIGPVPQFRPADLGILEHGNGSLADVLERARIVASDPSQMTWQIVRLPSIVTSRSFISLMLSSAEYTPKRSQSLG
jgi:hypothetical protein